MPKVDLKSYYIYISIIGLILMPLIFFPISGDLAIFINSSLLLDSGGRPYIDFIDIKPPAIFYFYWFVIKLVGSGEFGVRIFDYFFQLIALSTSFFFLNKLFNQKFISYYTGIIYALVYVSLNFNQTSHIEAFISLPIILILYLLISDNKSILFSVIIGFIIGILAGFKYTFGFSIFAVIIYYSINSKNQSTNTKKILLCIISSIITFVITLIPLFSKEVFTAFSEMLPYMQFYSALPALNTELPMYLTNHLLGFFVNNYSFLLTLCLIFGIWRIFNYNKVVSNSKISQFYDLILLVTLFLFISIVLERKFFIYHFTRMLYPLAIISAIGLAYIIENISENFKIFSFPKKLTLFVAFLIFIIFSPIPRIINIAQIPIKYITNIEAYNSHFSKSGNPIIARTTHLKVSQYINEQNINKGTVLVVTTGSNAVNYFIDAEQKTKFTQSCFYLSTAATDNYRELFLDELNQAEWLAIQKNDRHLFIMGHQKSSWESLVADELLFKSVESQFELETEIDFFKLYRRK